MIQLFDDVTKELNNVNTENLTQILNKKNEKFELDFFLKIEEGVHQCYSSSVTPFHSRDLVYFGLFQDDSLREKIEGKIQKFKILAFFEIENMQFYMIKMVFSGVMMLGEREVIFVKGLKKLDEGEFLEIWKSIPLDEDEIEKDNLIEIEFGMAEYIFNEQTGMTSYRSFVEFKPKIDIGLAILKPVYAEVRRNYLERSMEELDKVIKEQRNVWEYKLSTLDKIYK